MTPFTLLFSIAIASQVSPIIKQDQTPYENLVAQFENRLSTRSLRTFFHKNGSKFTVTMIYGSRGIPRSAESRVLQSMEELEEWLTPKGHHGELILFEREVGSRKQFGKDIFVYDYNKIEPNKLYLTRIRFNTINSIISIFDITFYDSSGL
jgi:hypothetical protein